MKKIHLLLLMVFGILFTACENQNCWLEEGEVIPAKPKKGTHINLGEALVIAENAVGRGVTRSTTSAVATVDYVLNNVKTRSQDLPDTLAYVINYADEGGFAIISADNRVQPVLAFSENGTFSFDNEIAVDNFINNLGEFISQNNETSFKGIVYPLFVQEVAPRIVTQIHQEAPFNKYVVAEYPNCPAGCVPVATALILIHTQDELLNYHNMNVSFKNIRKAMRGIYFPSSSGENIISTVADNPIPNPGSYQDAIDQIAKLLYYFGDDMGVHYGEGGSGTTVRAAYSFLNKYSPNLTTKNIPYVFKNVVEWMRQGEMVMLFGSGHAWVADGVAYTIDSQTNQKQYYIYCDWGWGGDGNGYYAGDVFEVRSDEMVVKECIGVKCMATD
ncbi:MAG: Spi family protease inhibitor [Muribaculaceae bacterium]|nr:Spi family protease inhibitor [Muribaculaceae bacterium]